MSRFIKAGHDKVRLGKAWHGALRQRNGSNSTFLGSPRLGKAWLAKAGHGDATVSPHPPLRPGSARRGLEWLGTATQRTFRNLGAGLCVAWQGVAGHGNGSTTHFTQGSARLEAAWPGLARLGTAQHGNATEVHS